MQWKDFTNCEIDLSANYGGLSRSLKKIMRGIDNDGL